ncbi:ammonium transporter AmtB-like domain-containing protein [Dunaliella salina]|uniref:Ammonium transporter AmtB-like domain-containing protein n=1 Tax=Dunaliella salina TaxID=3046 RepID=A0ABQ7GI38_DUNSA|nr:ammonium transporter AmtB-like domain-containing protein [Dunaliella salina]|eukprot:KAF5834280.1 ammonium transporter AmtB-like domain-containing protein [Dunaliella salina]
MHYQWQFEFAPGFVRTKNINNILLKNLMDASVASICWYVLGYGFAYGVSDHRSNAFIGNHDFALTHTVQNNWAFSHPEDDPGVQSGNLAGYFFQWAFVATTATIVSGGVAERITFVGYMSYVVWMVTWVYPVVVHAVWATGGWLHAFVSAGVVHLTGGLAALIGAWLLGPRVGRYKEDGSLNEDMNSSSNVLVVFGTLILWFGWYAFNPGSQLAVASPANAAIVARCAVTTTLSAASGGITCLFFRFWRSGQFDVLYTCNGILSGLVGVTAGPSLVEPWAAIIAGVFGSLTFYGSECVMHMLKIDDPVGAWSVHGAAGIYSVIFMGFFAKHDYVKDAYGNPVDSRRYGWFYGGHGQLMLCNVIEIIFILAWVGTNFFLLFGLLKITKKLRVPPEIEHAGLDASLHGMKKGHMLENGSHGSAHIDLTVSHEKK